MLLPRRNLRTSERTPTKSWQPMKPLLMLGLLLLALSLPTKCVNAQQPSASPSPVSREEFEKQKELLGKTLDKLTDVSNQLATVGPLVEAIKQERIAVESERKAAQREREANEKALNAADRAIAAEQKVSAAEAKVNETYEKKLVPAYDKLLDKQSARIEKLEDKLDKANARTVKVGLGALVLGLISRFASPF